MKRNYQSFVATHLIRYMALGAIVIAGVVGAVEAKGSEEISTDAANLIRRMEANTAQAVYRDAAGNVFSLHIYLGFASDTNLALVSEIKSLTNITLRTSSINNHSPQQGLRSCRKCQTLLAWALNAPTLCLMGFWLQAVNSNRYGSFVLGQLSRL